MMTHAERAAQHEAILRVVKNNPGLSYEVIGQRFGVSNTTVSRVARAGGIRKRREYSRKSRAGHLIRCSICGRVGHNKLSHQ